MVESYKFTVNQEILARKQMLYPGLYVSEENKEMCDHTRGLVRDVESGEAFSDVLEWKKAVTKAANLNNLI